MVVGHMGTVDTKDAILYGFEGMTYLALVILLSLGMIVGGGLLFSIALGEEHVLLLVASLAAIVVGFVVLCAGSLGMTYKVVADAVYKAAKG